MLSPDPRAAPKVPILMIMWSKITPTTHSPPSRVAGFTDLFHRDPQGVAGVLTVTILN